MFFSFIFLKEKKSFSVKLWVLYALDVICRKKSIFFCSRIGTSPPMFINLFYNCYFISFLQIYLSFFLWLELIHCISLLLKTKKIMILFDHLLISKNNFMSERRPFVSRDHFPMEVFLDRFELLSNPFLGPTCTQQ